MANSSSGSDDQYKTPTYIQIGEIYCPETGEQIYRYFADEDDKLPSFYQSHFIEDRIIGSGGFAVVAECKHCFDKRCYAIKKMPIGHDPNDSDSSVPAVPQASADAALPEASHDSRTLPSECSFASMIKEIVIWSGLDHKNIVRYYESWVENKFSGEIGETWEGGKIVRTKPCLYLQLELCESSLRAKLKPGDDCMLTWMTIDACKATFKDIVDGLAYIHDKGVMHGDISTDNILYGAGVAKITDFGLARMTETDEDVLAADTLYCAPEMLEPKAKPDSKADIYSVGIISFEMLQPFVTDIVRRLTFDKLARKKVFPDSWNDVLAKKWVMQMIAEPASARPAAGDLKANMSRIMTDIGCSKAASSC
ncbi:hypothetical protein ACLB2K_003535 [Fragaria x ananassa]